MDVWYNGLVRVHPCRNLYNGFHIDTTLCMLGFVKKIGKYVVLVNPVYGKKSNIPAIFRGKNWAVLFFSLNNWCWSNKRFRNCKSMGQYECFRVGSCSGHGWSITVFTYCGLGILWNRVFKSLTWIRQKRWGWISLHVKWLLQRRRYRFWENFELIRRPHLCRITSWLLWSGFIIVFRKKWNCARLGEYL